MKQKMRFILVLLIPTLIVLTGVYWNTHMKYYPKYVFWLPNGFVSLQDAVDNTNGVVEYVFFEEHISLVDKNGNSIGGALVRDRSFIVNYRGVYYINAEKFYFALEKAQK